MEYSLDQGQFNHSNHRVFQPINGEKLCWCRLQKYQENKDHLHHWTLHFFIGDASDVGRKWHERSSSKYGSWYTSVAQRRYQQNPEAEQGQWVSLKTWFDLKHLWYCNAAALHGLGTEISDESARDWLCIKNKPYRTDRKWSCSSVKFLMVTELPTTVGAALKAV